jgi:hypothetical protein
MATSPITIRRRRHDRKPAASVFDWLDMDLLRDHLAAPDVADWDAGWRSGALPCASSPVDMHPENAGGVTKAKEVCEDCAAIYPCLAYALMTSAVELDFGVWGRTSRTDRRKIRKRLTVPALRQLRVRGVSA